MRRSLCALVMMVAACGGSKKTAAGPDPDDTTATDTGVAGGGGADTGGTGGTGGTDTAVVTGVNLPDAGPPPPPPSPYTIELKNDGATDLVFAIDKGWQTAIFAYTGKPPKARSALLFPTYCTESCDATADMMCPVCKEPEKPKDRQKADLLETKRETAPAGGSFKLDWDGKVFVYEKAPSDARKKKKKCECWRKVDPAPDTYTIKACGLRPSAKPGEPSRPVCAETQVALPAPTTPTTITLTFPAK